MTIYTGEVFTKGVLSGIEKAYKSILPSYGPSSMNVVIDKDGKPYSTKDGATIIESLVFENRLEDTGLKLVQVAAHNTMLKAGDGTSLTVIFTYHLIRELNKLVVGGFNPLHLIRDLEIEIKNIIGQLQEKSHNIESEKDIYNILYNSCREEDLASKMSDLFGYVGENGIITIEEGVLPETTYKYTDGYSFDAGLLDPVFANDSSGIRCILEEPYVLIYLDLIRHTRHLLPIINKVNNEGKSLFLIMGDITGDALEFLKVNVHQKNIKLNVVRIPYFGEKGDAYTRDIAAVTGAKIFDPNRNPIDRITLEDLGRAKKIITNKESTLIYEGEGDYKDHLDRLIEIGKDKDRIARLSGGIGSLFIGGHTESEMIERKMRAEDALASIQSAMKYGYINNVANTLHNLQTENTIVGKILNKIFKQPLQIICANTDGDYQEIKGKAEKKIFDFETRSWKNGKNSELIDSALVPIEALRNAFSVVKTIIGGNVGVIKE